MYRRIGNQACNSLELYAIRDRLVANFLYLIRRRPYINVTKKSAVRPTLYTFEIEKTCSDPETVDG